MEHHTILYIFDHANRSNSVVAAIKETGCEVISTHSPAEGIALLYILSQVAAVVLDRRALEHASFDVARSLRRIRPNVPVMLQCGEQVDSSPSRTEGCMNTDRVVFALQHLLTEETVA